MTWNVLADAYIRPEYYPGAEPALLRPGARTQAIAERIEASDADVVCLQEVEPAVLRALARWDLHHARKRGKPDACVIATRRRAMIEQVRSFAFTDGAPDREDSGHVAMIAIVALAGGARVQLATTHLRWDRPGTPPADRWTVRQARELIDALDPAIPAIVCGDLNVVPHDEAYAMLRAVGLVDPCADLAPTANPNGRACRIDHVLHARELQARVAPGLSIEDTTPLPSPAMPSDHAPVVVWFEIPSRGEGDP
jgi:endonuclease/exonuclease/phosphatase family metal-dependent hydrolase